MTTEQKMASTNSFFLSKTAVGVSSMSGLRTSRNVLATSSYNPLTTSATKVTHVTDQVSTGSDMSRALRETPTIPSDPIGDGIRPADLNVSTTDYEIKPAGASTTSGAFSSFTTMNDSNVTDRLEVATSSRAEIDIDISWKSSTSDAIDSYLSSTVASESSFNFKTGDLINKTTAKYTGSITTVTERYLNISTMEHWMNGTTGDYGNVSAEDYLQELNAEFASLLFPAIVVLGVLMVLGAVGNIFVLHVYTWRMKGGTITRFIQALAVFDLLSCCVAIPGELVDMSNNYTFGRDPFCKFFRTINLFCTVASGGTLIVVAIDRYKRICFPLRRQIAPKGAVIIMCCCSLASLVFSLPTAVLYGGMTVTTDLPYVNGSDCSFNDRFIHTMFPLIYNAMQMGLFFTGALILIVLYSLIARRVFHHVHLRQQRRQSLNLGRYKYTPCSPSFGSSPTTTTENALSPDTTSPTPIQPHAGESPISKEKGLSDSQTNQQLRSNVRNTDSSSSLPDRKIGTVATSEQHQHGSEQNDAKKDPKLATIPCTRSDGIDSSAALRNESPCLSRTDKDSSVIFSKISPSQIQSAVSVEILVDAPMAKQDAVVYQSHEDAECNIPVGCTAKEAENVMSNNMTDDKAVQLEIDHSEQCCLRAGNARGTPASSGGFSTEETTDLSLTTDTECQSRVASGSPVSSPSETETESCTSSDQSLLGSDHKGGHSQDKKPGDGHHLCLNNRFNVEVTAGSLTGRSQPKRLEDANSWMPSVISLETNNSNVLQCPLQNYAGERIENEKTAAFAFINSPSNGQASAKLDGKKNQPKSRISSNTLLVRRREKLKEMGDPRWKRHSFTLESLPISFRPKKKVLFRASVGGRERKTGKKEKQSKNVDVVDVCQESDKKSKEGANGQVTRRPTRRASSLKGLKDLKNLALRSESSGTRRTTLMLFLITLVYVLSFLPHLILMTIKSLDERSLSGYGGSWELALNILIRSYFINSVANPIIYSFFSKNFFRECKNSLRCCNASG